MSTTIQAAIDKFTAEPAAGRTAPKVTATRQRPCSVGGRLVRMGLRPASHTWWEQRVPQSDGIPDGRPAGCAVAFINDTLAPQFDVEITDVNATVNCSADLGGLLGIDLARPDLADLRVEISISSYSPPDRVDALRQAWLNRCPIYLALRNANDLTAEFTAVPQQ